MAIWPRRRRTPDPDVQDAKRRLEEAEKDLEQARVDDRKVNEIAHRLAEIRRANRFGALMRDALRGSE